MVQLIYNLVNKIKKYSDKYFFNLTNYKELVLENRDDLLEDLFIKAKQHFLVVENYLYTNSPSYKSFSKIENHKDNFLELYKNSFKIKGSQVSGGQGIIGLLFISYISSLLKINHIYEFGSFNFFLTKTLDDVLPKDIKIDTYDVIQRDPIFSLSKRVHINHGEPLEDFKQHFNTDLRDSLFILDDRINQQDRFNALIKLGAKKIIFIDDLLSFGKLNFLSNYPNSSISMSLKNPKKDLLILPIPAFTFAGILRETDSVYIEII